MIKIIFSFILFFILNNVFSQRTPSFFEITESIFNASIKESNIHIFNTDSDIILSGDFLTKHRAETIWIEPRNGYSITIIPNEILGKSSTVGITDDETTIRHKNTTITIHPNPTKSTLTINSKLKISRITLYNNFGVKQKIVLIKNTLDLTNFKNGIYLLKIHLDNNQLITKRIIKN